MSDFFTFLHPCEIKYFRDQILLKNKKHIYVPKMVLCSKILKNRKIIFDRLHVVSLLGRLESLGEHLDRAQADVHELKRKSASPIRDAKGRGRRHLFTRIR